MNPTKEHIEIAKDNGQDFEFYPTTNAIIARLISRLKEINGPYTHSFPSILDIGAGNGKVLEALRDAETVSSLYAIEKSRPLLACLPSDVFIVGTEFAEQSLFDKEAEITFSNPPYSEFEKWAEKIIRETASDRVFLVIPERWKNSQTIQSALDFRKVEAKSIGSFNFENAEDREARAKVELIEISFSRSNSAFTASFKETFPNLTSSLSSESVSQYQKDRREDADAEQKAQELVKRDDFVQAVVALYQAELEKIQNNYAKLDTLDAALLAELEIDLQKILGFLSTRLKGLKRKYWKIIFDNLDAVTDRLTTKSRKEMLDTLFSHTNIDFTVSNVYAIVLWVVNHANEKFGAQFCDTYEDMVSSANVRGYKSNQKVFEFDWWRYKNNEFPEGEAPERFALEYRIVCEHTGGIFVSEWGTWEKEQFKGLNERAHDFLADLCTIARNLGFDSPESPRDFEWSSGTKSLFTYSSKETGKREKLFEARAFQNQNIHLRLAPKFALALNVEYGRLKGWLNTGKEAAAELQDEKAAHHFGSLHQLRITDSARVIDYTPESSESSEEPKEKARAEANPEPKKEDSPKPHHEPERKTEEKEAKPVSKSDLLAQVEQMMLL